MTSWCLDRLRSRNRSPGWKITPGERTSWDTTTRSVPLMMKVPFSVIMGKSPMKTVCSLISPVLAFMKRARAKIGAEKVMSFSLHSSTVNLGGGRRSSSKGSNSSSRLQRLGEVPDRGDVPEGVGEPLLDEPLEGLPLDGDEVRQFENLVEVRERITVPDGGTSGQLLLLGAVRADQRYPYAPNPRTPSWVQGVVGKCGRQGTATGHGTRAELAGQQRGRETLAPHTGPNSTRRAVTRRLRGA